MWDPFQMANSWLINGFYEPLTGIILQVGFIYGISSFQSIMFGIYVRFPGVIFKQFQGAKNEVFDFQGSMGLVYAYLHLPLEK